MLHATIYRTEPGFIIVVEAGSLDYAVSGGNVCAIAQKKGIGGFVVDGVILDVAEVREARFPVFAREIMPKPGIKESLGTLNEPINCGGVKVNSGDIVLADEEGIVIIPKSKQHTVYQIALARMEKEASETLEEWQVKHHAKVEKILKDIGFAE